MKKILSFAYLWVLALPLFLIFAGAASNQLVIAANHDRFPVMLNARKLREIKQREEDREDIVAALASRFGIHIQHKKPVDDGMIDDVHCVMTKDTHLNFLADWIDLGSIYSPGDLFIMLGQYLEPASFPLWFGLILCEYRRKALVQEGFKKHLEQCYDLRD